MVHKEDGKTVALSFKSSRAANEVWNKVNILQERDENELKDPDSTLEKVKMDNLIKITGKIYNSVFLFSKS